MPVEPVVTISLKEYNDLIKIKNQIASNSMTIGERYDVSINNEPPRMWMCREFWNGSKYIFVANGIGTAMDKMEISLHK